MNEIGLRNYAYIGDAVWEIFVREHTVYKTQNSKELHALTTKYVCAEFQANLLDRIRNCLTEFETELVRKAGNLTVPVSRRNIQNEYRRATSFEALIGQSYLNDKKRLSELYIIIENTDLFLL